MLKRILYIYIYIYIFKTYLTLGIILVRMFSVAILVK